jgi:hypothetical protein
MPFDIWEKSPAAKEDDLKEKALEVPFISITGNPEALQYLIEARKEFMRMPSIRKREIIGDVTIDVQFLSPDMARLDISQPVPKIPPAPKRIEEIVQRTIQDQPVPVITIVDEYFNFLGYLVDGKDYHTTDGKQLFPAMRVFFKPKEKPVLPKKFNSTSGDFKGAIFVEKFDELDNLWDGFQRISNPSFIGSDWYQYPKTMTDIPDPPKHVVLTGTSPLPRATPNFSAPVLDVNVLMGGAEAMIYSGPSIVGRQPAEDEYGFIFWMNDVETCFYPFHVGILTEANIYSFCVMRMFNKGVEVPQSEVPSEFPPAYTYQMLYGFVYKKPLESKIYITDWFPCERDLVGASTFRSEIPGFTDNPPPDIPKPYGAGSWEGQMLPGGGGAGRLGDQSLTAFQYERVEYNRLEREYDL